MSAGMPELGSKISLISKADIRYEGHLFTVDPQQCTIALAAVRSFGTEERETNYPVPPQNQVYDYILFRGSDIKDIRVVNNVTSLPNDPAIMQLSMPPSLGNKPFQPQGFTHPVLGQMGQYPPYNTMDALAPGMRIPSMLANKPNLISGASRSTTPASLISRKSPTTEQGTQAGGKREEKKTIKPMQHPTTREKKDSRSESQQEHITQNNRQASSQRFNQQRQGNWVQRGAPRQRARGRPRGMGAPLGNTGYNQNRSHQGNSTGKPKIKFEGDYDFEQANSQFEELCGKLGKVKIEETKPEINAATALEIEKKDDSGNETGAGENELEEEADIMYYDKAKSFFDNISCEAVERSKGRSQRTDWRTERKLNSETFGVASARRGSYRGRGGYRGNFRGRYNNRGGYRNQAVSRDMPNSGENSRDLTKQPVLVPISVVPSTKTTTEESVN